MSDDLLLYHTVKGKKSGINNCKESPLLTQFIPDEDFFLNFPFTLQEISHHVRQLLDIEEPPFSRSIALPYRDNMGLFLEQKSRTGKKSDALTYSKFIQDAHLEMYEPREPRSSIPRQMPSPTLSSLALK